MRLSRYFLPVLKETPTEAEIVSHQLMLRAGLVRQQGAGIYAWLPLGKRVLDKIEQIVREEQDRSGAIEVLMPTIQSSDLWRESGRYDAYGPEMLRFTDRRERELLYGPTNEEMITTIFKDGVRSYRDLPRNLYHIQWKFRDEMRPRFGVMRGREFLMKDAYSFDMDASAARHSYNKMFLAYLRTFKRLGLTAIPMRADTGPIGGDLSHEFIVLAPTGESEVYFDKAWHDDRQTYEALPFGYDDADALQAWIDEQVKVYAATDEKRDLERETAIGNALVTGRGVEVGHIFYFGTKYTKAMNCTVQGKDGQMVHPEMGSYGIGVSRLVGAIIEACHDKDGIVWPEAVAPFRIGLINLRADDGPSAGAADALYAQLTAAGVEVLYDDRDERGGTKFATMDLIGLPWQITIGPKGVEKGIAEMKNRKTGEKSEVALNAVLAQFVPSLQGGAGVGKP
jgi:prolyl-tRNA synthetase